MVLVTSYTCGPLTYCSGILKAFYGSKVICSRGKPGALLLLDPPGHTSSARKGSISTRNSKHWLHIMPYELLNQRERIAAADQSDRFQGWLGH